MNNTYYIYREAESLEELRAILHLRYKVFREAHSDWIPFHNVDKIGLELDQFDLYAQHFGLFRVTDGVSEAVGYRRIVSEERSPMCEQVRIIASVSEELTCKLHEPRDHPLPLIMYHPQKIKIYEFYVMCKDSGLKVVEPSRSSLDQPLHSIKMAKFFFESAFATGLVDGVDEALITCVSGQKKFYGLFGFTELEGTDDSFCSYVGKKISCLRASNHSLPSAMADTVNKMAEAYRATGSICYNSSEPDNFYAPAENKETAYSHLLNFDII